MSGVSAELRAFVLALVVGGASVTGAQAQGLVNVPKLSAPLANQLVGDTVAICAQKGYKVTAVVVDLDGVRQAFLRGNGAPIHSSDNAFYKAYSAASVTLARNEGSTKAVAERMAKSSSDNSAADATPQCHICGRGGDHHGRRGRYRCNRREWSAGRPNRRRLCPRSPRQSPGSDQIARWSAEVRRDSVAAMNPRAFSDNVDHSSWPGLSGHPRLCRGTRRGCPAQGRA